MATVTTVAILRNKLFKVQPFKIAAKNNWYGTNISVIFLWLVNLRKLTSFLDVYYEKKV